MFSGAEDLNPTIDLCSVPRIPAFSLDKGVCGSVVNLQGATRFPMGKSSVDNLLGRMLLGSYALETWGQPLLRLGMWHMKIRLASVPEA
jgi:hypothetical protein